MPGAEQGGFDEQTAITDVGETFCVGSGCRCSIWAVLRKTSLRKVVIERERERESVCV